MDVRSALSSLCLALCLSACGLSGQQRPISEPHPLTGCSALDEASCNTAPSCVAIYGEEDAPQPVPVVAALSGCMPFEPVQPLPFHHCEDAAPADHCAGLGEAACSATPGCAYLEAMPAVKEGGVGPDADAVAVSPAYGGCVQVDACAGLDEAACGSTPGCAVVQVAVGMPAQQGDVTSFPVYGGCAQAPVAPGPNPVDPPVAGGGCSEVMCMMYCERGFALDAEGCPTCACLP
ncbi:MAG: hypothetical protein FJ086_14390 [Deltaproteobacteria bacterium]|nr:hypothetical protein [Deltaproteobacteria bacterium]